MIAAEGDGQSAFPGVGAYCFGHGLGNLRNETWVLEFSDRRVVAGGDVLKAMMTIELDLPSQIGELGDESGFDKAYGAMIDARFGLRDQE
jgi:hypothetical protein